MTPGPRFNRRAFYVIKLPEGMVQYGDGRSVPLREFLNERVLVIDKCNEKKLGKINLLDLFKKYQE